MRSKTAFALNHPNISYIGEQDGHAFIAMEFKDDVTQKHMITGHALDNENLLSPAIPKIMQTFSP